MASVLRLKAWIITQTWDLVDRPNNDDGKNIPNIEVRIMTFEEAYSALKAQGAKTIPFQTSGSKFVDVWASELVSGARKGERVIRIQWASSSSNLDDDEWGKPKSSLIKYLRTAIEATVG